MQEGKAMIFSSYRAASVYKHNNNLSCTIRMYPLGMNGKADYMLESMDGLTYWNGKEFANYR